MVEAKDDVVDCNEASDNGQKDEDGVSRFGQTSRSRMRPRTWIKSKCLFYALNIFILVTNNLFMIDKRFEIIKALPPLG